jgi:hypothetical protein
MDGETGAERPPLARTSHEAHLFMDLRPCRCGESRFERANAVVALPGGGLGAHYQGSCPRCGAAREFVFRLPERALEPTADMRYGAAEPSELIDAGEWLSVADRYATSVPAAAHRLPEVERRRACARLGAATAAVEEALKFVPAGADRVPMSAVWSESGRSVYAAEPGRFRASRLTAVRDAYRDALRRADGLG